MNEHIQMSKKKIKLKISDKSSQRLAHLIPSIFRKHGWRLHPISKEVILIRRHPPRKIEGRGGRFPAEEPCSLEGVYVIEISQITKKRRVEKNPKAHSYC